MLRAQRFGMHFIQQTALGISKLPKTSLRAPDPTEQLGEITCSVFNS